MSILSNRVVAGTIARAQQALTVLARTKIATDAAARLPEFTAVRSELSIPTRLGPVAAAVYRPSDANESAPVHVNFHGGGYVLAVTALDDALCRAIAAESGSVVLNVDYAVAPQHPFPAPPEQAFEVVQWVAAHGAEHGWDGSRLTIGGQSAGGGLAAAVARQALEHSGPPIALQVLHYPPLDLSVSAGAKPSTIAKPMLRPWMGEVYDSSYIPDEADRSHPLASPAGATDTADLAGIAPAVIIAAAQDILRDEARRYADRLDTAGALIEYYDIAAADHGYDLSDDTKARESYRLIARHIQRATSS